MNSTRNMDLRWMCRTAGVPLWRVAEEMKIGDATLFRYLNKQLTEAERQRFFDALNRIIAARSAKPTT